MPKKYIWNTKYTIQHSIECSQTTKCIQYNIHDTKSCKLPKYRNMKVERCTTDRKVAVLRLLFTTIIIKRMRKRLVISLLSTGPFL